MNKEEMLEQMLIETVSILESCNLLELLPARVLGYYDQQKMDGLIQDDFTPAERLILEAARRI